MTDSLKLKGNRFTITAWEQPLPRNMNIIKFMIWQTELTKDGRKHWQTYIETFNDYTPLQIKNIFKSKTMCVEHARECREINIMYCSKPDTYYNERYMYVRDDKNDNPKVYHFYKEIEHKYPTDKEIKEMEDYYKKKELEEEFKLVFE